MVKSALIFGGAGGIGTAIAKKLKELGYKVMIADLRQPSGQLADYYIATDVTYEIDIKRALAAAQDRFGLIGAVISCQGVYVVEAAEKTALADWERMITVNLKSVFLVCKNVVPIMRRQKSGYIVNLASMAGLRALPGEAAYCASKFGVVGFSEALFEELKDTGVRITAVCPSSVDTPLLHRALRLTGIERKKVLQPEDVAAVVAELICSPPRVLRRIVPIEIAHPLNKLERKRAKK